MRLFTVDVMGEAICGPSACTQFMVDVSGHWRVFNGLGTTTIITCFVALHPSLSNVSHADAACHFCRQVSRQLWHKVFSCPIHSINS